MAQAPRLSANGITICVTAGCQEPLPLAITSAHRIQKRSDLRIPSIGSLQVHSRNIVPGVAVLFEPLGSLPSELGIASKLLPSGIPARRTLKQRDGELQNRLARIRSGSTRAGHSRVSLNQSSLAQVCHARWQSSCTGGRLTKLRLCESHSWKTIPLK
jgi:hypothetical protein